MQIDDIHRDLQIRRGNSQVVNGGGVGLAVTDEAQARAAKSQHRRPFRLSFHGNNTEVFFCREN